MKPISVPDRCSRIAADAARNTVKCPLAWTAKTSSQSDSVMLNSIRSRRMPATHTTPSMEPQESTAALTMRSPASILETSSATATASTPRLRTSATTLSAISDVGSSPAIDTP